MAASGGDGDSEDDTLSGSVLGASAGGAGLPLSPEQKRAKSKLGEVSHDKDPICAAHAV